MQQHKRVGRAIEGPGANSASMTLQVALGVLIILGKILIAYSIFVWSIL